MKRKILTILRGSGEYVSGQQLCDALGVSRTAIWKHINALKAEGYEIAAVPNRGYHLTASPDVLSEAEVGSRRRDLWAEAPLIVFDRTDSTNIQAGRLAEEGAPEGTLVIADVQTGGKGRRGRGWETPAGEALAMSFLLRPSFSPEIASMLTLVAAMAAQSAVRELTGMVPGIKWPNDLVLNHKKICGILTEMKLEERDISQIVVGMGFNVSQTAFSGELADKATSLWMESGVRYSRAELCCLVMKYFGEYYRVFCGTGDLSGLRRAYEENLLNLGEEVRILSPGEEWTGTARGINDRGELLVEDAAGEIHAVASGEVSVRGLYSYT